MSRAALPPLRLALLLALAPLAGCHSYLLPFDERPTLARTPLDTAGGARVDVSDDGELVLRPARDDVSAALGVGLFEAPDGLLVTHRLRADAVLQPDDRIVHVGVELPRTGGAIRRNHADALEKQVRGLKGIPLGRQLEDASASMGDYAGRPVEGAFDEWDPSTAALEDEKQQQAERARTLDRLREAGALPPLDDGQPGEGGDGQTPDGQTPAGQPAVSDGETATPEAPPSLTPAEVRARPWSHPVQRLADLVPYLTTRAWATLDLVVKRGEGEVAVRLTLDEERRPLPIRAWRPQLTHWHGLELVRVADLAPEQWPVHASARDFLVVRAARDAPAARAGLRPLDLVPLASIPALLAGDLGPGTLGVLSPEEAQAFDLLRVRARAQERGLAVVREERQPDGGVEVWVQDVLAEAPRLYDRISLSTTPVKVDGDRVGSRVYAKKPDGSVRDLRLEPREAPTDLWFPFVFSYQHDGARTHLGFGPLELLFHYSSRSEYVPTTDSYQETWRYSWGSSLQGAGIEREAGETTREGVDFLLDGARTQYLIEWADAAEEGRRRRGWTGD